jgi:hypothetical protein
MVTAESAQSSSANMQFIQSLQKCKNNRQQAPSKSLGKLIYHTRTDQAWIIDLDLALTILSYFISS